MYTEFNDEIRFTEFDAAMLDKAAANAGVSLDSVTVKIDKPAWSAEQDVLTFCLVNSDGVLSAYDRALFCEEWLKMFGYRDWCLYITSNVAEHARNIQTGSSCCVKTVKDNGRWCYA